jgi:hypothetical protein
MVQEPWVWAACLRPVVQPCGSPGAYCWGLGFLGHATIFQSLTPVAVAGGLAFHQVSPNGEHTCGVTTGNLAYCWGQNGNGELGDGTRTTRRRPTPVAGAT